MAVTILNHPIGLSALAKLRDVESNTITFRQSTLTVSRLLAVETLRDLRTSSRLVRTPLEELTMQVVEEQVALISVLRAGTGLLDGFLELVPDAALGCLGLRRDELTAEATSYYLNLPDLTGKFAVILDPMLATGGSAIQALDAVQAAGPARVKFVCVVAAPEGIDRVLRRYPDIEIITTAVDRELNSRKYILPGLGDFGDRLYGTG